MIRNKFARFVFLRAALFAWLAAIAIGPLAAPATARAAASFKLTIGQMTTGRNGYAMAVLQSGKVLIAGGIGGIEVTLPVFDTAVIYDPQTGTFSPTAGNMNAAREYATATTLPDGRVLIAGGQDLTGALASAELYDPATGTFTPTANDMSVSRTQATATLLPDGTVLIAGGSDNGNPVKVLDSAEIFDPSTNKFSLLKNSMTEPRIQFTATLLQNGTVLLAGGGTIDAASAEIYDPATQTFSPTIGSMNSQRFGPTATLLPSGRVLIAGGRNGTTVLASTDIFDPASGTFSPGPAMDSPRVHHFAILLQSGQVLIGGGGTDIFDHPTASVELYDPLSNSFRPTSGPLHIARAIAGANRAALLPDGRVLIVGGTDDQGNIAGLQLADGEIYNPVHDDFTVTGGLNAPRSGQTATVLRNGNVLIAGGIDGKGVRSTSAEIYNRRTGISTPTAGPLHVPRAGQCAVRLKDGRVLLAGGSGDQTAEIFNPKTRTFRLSAGRMIAARVAATATLLKNGTVLIAGGLNDSGDGLSSAEIYHPRSDTFSAVPNSMTVPRAIFASVRLRNGNVLLVGGSTDASYAHALNSAEIYNFRKRTFTATGSMASARAGLAAVRLKGGKVLVTGGIDQSLTVLDTAEVYHPNTGAFTPTANTMSSPRFLHTATLLKNGHVLIAGGDFDSFNSTASTDLYHPRTEKFTAGPMMTAPRDFHTASLLKNGSVLITGGRGVVTNDAYVWATTELFVP